MLRNYFKIAFRNLLKYKGFTFINFMGLAVGFTCCFLLTLYILDELSYDRFHAKANRIYRVTRDFVGSDGNTLLHLGNAAPPFGPLLKQEFPEIESMARVLEMSALLEETATEKSFNEERVFFAEPALFDIFSIKTLKGHPHKALDEPYQIMLSDNMAEKYFQGEDPVGKVLRVDNQYQVKVTGVFESMPTNSFWHPQFLLSFATLEDSTVYGGTRLRTSFGSNSFGTFLLLPENYPAEQLQTKLPAFIDKIFPQSSGSTSKQSDRTHLYLQKITDIHLHSHLDSEVEPNGDIASVRILGLVGLVILLIACINFINLSTARSASRAKEVGIRKTVGAGKKSLVLQFLLESVLLTIMATLLAVLLTELALPWLNSFTKKELSADFLSNAKLLLVLLALPVLVGVLAGLYPAVYLSRFQPVKVLKGSLSSSARNPVLRKALVVVQFSISIVLIIATGLMFRQLLYMQDKELGFDKEQLVVVPYGDAMREPYKAFKAELLRSPLVETVGRSGTVPTQRLLGSMGSLSVERGDSVAPTKVMLKYVSTDQDLFKTYKAGFAAGRDFSFDHPTDDTAAFVLNATAARQLGWQDPQEAIDQSVRYGNRRGRIIGVVQDFHFESLHEEISPIIFFSDPEEYSSISVKISGDPQQALAHIRQTWQKFMPKHPFEYEFMDEMYAKQYEAEQQKGTIFTLFSGIAIFIACLGLFGLASFTTVQRTKEIGIRKVFGASVTGIVGLISKDFLVLVLIANLIAWPVAWYAMRKWLEDFAYRIEIGPGMFALAALLAFGIAVLTISWQAIRAATANPVRSLRSE